jgi:PPOX class probable F420-dependent enzyme
VRLPEPDARQRFASAPVARLATAGPDGRPHLVPVTIVLDSQPGQGDRIYTAVDAKPKTTSNLQRLRNIRANPQVAVLADHYQPDWAGLWWVRADGHATIVAEPAAMAPALALLAGRYPQYQQQPPAGPVIRIQVTRWAGWAAAAA